MWLFEFILGMIIAYIIISPSFRRFVWGNTKNKRPPNIEDKDDDEIETAPTSQQPANPYIKGVEADEAQVKKWLGDNPELLDSNQDLFTNKKE